MQSIRLQMNNAKYPFHEYHHAISMDFPSIEPEKGQKDLVDYFYKKLAEFDLAFNGGDKYNQTTDKISRLWSKRGVQKIYNELSNDKSDAVNLSCYSEEARKNKIAECYISRLIISNGSKFIIFTIDDKTVPYNFDWFIGIMKEIYKYTACQYGYYFHWPLKGGPDVYAAGYDFASQTIREIEITHKWQEALNMRGEIGKSKEKLLTYIRDIYKINILSPKQLGREVFPGLSLKQWIEAGGKSWMSSTPQRGELLPFAGDMLCWSVPEEKTRKNIKKILEPTGIIICTDKYNHGFIQDEREFKDSHGNG